jgi:hypothetical protein
VLNTKGGHHSYQPDPFTQIAGGRGIQGRSRNIPLDLVLHGDRCWLCVWQR